MGNSLTSTLIFQTIQDGTNRRSAEPATRLSSFSRKLNNQFNHCPSGFGITRGPEHHTSKIRNSLDSRYIAISSRSSLLFSTHKVEQQDPGWHLRGRSENQEHLRCTHRIDREGIPHRLTRSIRRCWFDFS